MMKQDGIKAGSFACDVAWAAMQKNVLKNKATKMEWRAFHRLLQNGHGGSWNTDVIL